MDDTLFADIEKVFEFAQLAERMAGVEGWLSPVEGYLLYRLARDGAGQGAIVEIGSWMGRSTAWLAAGSKAAGREHVHAVDTFNGGPMLKDLEVIRKEGTTYHRFAENLERLGLLDHVEPIVAESDAAAKRWTGGMIRLLFIDGDHSYSAVRQDFDLWSPHVVVGGQVVFDDASETYPGVLQLIGETLAHDRQWVSYLGVGKMRALIRAA